jgi:endonuclease YncB( thermonuclease family)
VIAALALVLALEPSLVRVAQPSVEVEARLCGRAEHHGGVVDGDTLDVFVTRIVDEPKHGEARCAACLATERAGREVHGDTRVRLGGGVDAPEAGKPGGDETRDFLLALFTPGETLYLDVDDDARGCPAHHHRGRDKYCRLLAHVYVRRGDDWVDVNATLVAWGRAHYPQHDWLRYAAKPKPS